MYQYNHIFVFLLSRMHCSFMTLHILEEKMELAFIPGEVPIKEGGYDYQFVEDPPPESLKCLICDLVARKPQQHVGNCGKLFCKTCIVEYRGNNCPHCRQINRHSQTEESSNSVSQLLSLSYKEPSNIFDDAKSEF